MTLPYWKSGQQYCADGPLVSIVPPFHINFAAFSHIKWLFEVDVLLIEFPLGTSLNVNGFKMFILLDVMDG